VKLRYKWALPILTISNICVVIFTVYPSKIHWNILCLRKQGILSEWVNKERFCLVRETSRLSVKLHCVSCSLTWNVCHHKSVYVLTHTTSQLMEMSNFITSDKQKCSCACWDMTLCILICSGQQRSSIQNFWSTRLEVM
jgi:hypothetical protein